MFWNRCPRTSFKAILLLGCLTLDSRAFHAQENVPLPRPNYSGVRPPSLPTLAPGQKMIVLARGNRTHAVKIQDVLVDGKKIISQQAFEASSDWLSNVVVVLRNDSPKTLVCAMLQVDFPEYPGHSTDDIYAGRPPGPARYDSTGVLREPDLTTTAIAIVPGGIVRVPINSFLNRFTRTLLDTTAKPTDVHIVQIELRLAYFADGTRWQYGNPATSYAKPDKDHPGHWISMTPEEFGPINPSR